LNQYSLVFINLPSYFSQQETTMSLNRTVLFATYPAFKCVDIPLSTLTED